MEEIGGFLEHNQALFNFDCVSFFGDGSEAYRKLSCDGKQVMENQFCVRFYEFE